MSHPRAATLATWLASLAPDVGERLAHLLTCPRCRGWALGRLPARRGARSTAREWAALEYSAMWPRLERASREAGRRLVAERQGLSPLLAELLRLPADERHGRVESDARFHSFLLFQRLVELTLAPPRGEAGVPLGRLALDLVRLLGSLVATPDLAAAAHVTLAEALRREGDLAAAEGELLRAAAELRGVTPVESDTRAFYCQTLAAVRRDQDRFDEALALLGHAAELWRDLADGEAEAWACLELGELALVEALDPARALAAFDTAAAIAGISGRTACFALAGGLRALAALELPQEALSLLAQSREQSRFAPGSYEALVLKALEGRLERRCGRLGRARQRLGEAFRGLRRAQAGPEAVLAGVEWLEALAADPQSRDVLARVAAELGAAAARLSPGVREAVRFCLERSAEPRFPRLLRSLADYLERCRWRPRLSFPAADFDVAPPIVH